MSIVKDIIVAARTYLATITVSRDATEFFLPHQTNQPFEHSPISKRDGFEIIAQEEILTHGFGTAGDKEGQFILLVKVGHAPFGSDDERENYRARDVARVGDLFEAYGSWPAGLMGIWFERVEVNKDLPNWWISKMNFRVMYAAPIEVA